MARRISSASGSSWRVRSPGMVLVVALAVLLAKSSGRVQREVRLIVGRVRRIALGVRAMHVDAHIDSRHVEHREDAHRHAPGLERAVDLARCRALQHHALRLARVALHHAIADEAVADAAPAPASCASVFARSSAVRMTAGAVSPVRTTSSSGMTLAGEKKCNPTTSSGRRVAAAIAAMSRVEVLVASTAPGFVTCVEGLKDLLLEIEAFVHRLDHHVGCRRGRRIQGCRESAPCAGPFPPRSAGRA